MVLISTGIQISNHIHKSVDMINNLQSITIIRIHGANQNRYTNFNHLQISADMINNLQSITIIRIHGANQYRYTNYLYSDDL